MQSMAESFPNGWVLHVSMAGEGGWGVGMDPECRIGELVLPLGLEPKSSAPEANVLSIELWKQFYQMGN